MEVKKNNQYVLENKRFLFFNIGIIISLTLVITAFEWKFYDKAEKVKQEVVVALEDQIVPITEIPEPEPPKPKVIAREFIETTEPEPELPEVEIIIDQQEIINFEPFVVIEDLTLEPEEVSDEPFLIVEDMPEPIGGYAAFYQHVSNNIRYPQQARRMGIEGKVFIGFVVDEYGRLTQLKVVKGIGAGCDEEALRVVQTSPPWKPGNQRGKNVKVRMVVPIRFMLERHDEIG